MLSLEITIFSVFFLHNKTPRTAVFIWDHFNSNYVLLFIFHPVLSSFIIHLLELYNYKAFRTLRAYPLFKPLIFASIFLLVSKINQKRFANFQIIFCALLKFHNNQKLFDTTFCNSKQPETFPGA